MAQFKRNKSDTIRIRQVLNLHYFTQREDWRTWLEANHATQREVWLVFFRKHTDQPSLLYEDAVEEALCFGWIDSIVKRLDENRYVRKFTPRVNNQKWSISNRQRMIKLVKEGRMQPAGMAAITFPLDSTEPALSQPQPKELPVLPVDLENALRANSKAWEAFNRLAPSHRRNYLRWVMSAKKAETQRRRMDEVIGVLERGEPLGLK